MKKRVRVSLVSLMLLLATPVLAWSQTANASSADEKGFQQYQQFSWQPVAKASKYEIDLEKKGVGGAWESAAKVQTRATKKEVLLYPGEYRVSIAAFTILGKKASASAWVEFTMLNETEPYLYDDYLKKSSTWNSPVLHIKKTDPNAEGITEASNDEDMLTADVGDPANSFLLKAKNVFFPETRFYLVPVSESSSGGKPFEAYVDNRKQSPLTIVRRDRDNSGIVVAYNSDDLFSGYYNIVVENPGKLTASLCILVLADRTPKIENKLYAYNTNYKTSEIALSRSESEVFSVSGSGFDNNCVFTLKPTTEGIPYPFASEMPRSDVELTLTNRSSLDDKGRMQLDFTINSQSMQTGYYKFTAANGVAGMASIVILVKMNDDAASTKPKVSSMSSALNKKSNTLTFTLRGDNLVGASFVLVSTVTGMGVNERIPLTFLDSKWGGAKIILDADASKLPPGEYALLVEHDNASRIQYVELKENNHASLTTIENPDEKFLVPADFSYIETTTEEETAQITLEPNVVNVTKANRFVLPFFFFDIDLPNDSNISVTGMFDIIDFGWFATKAGMTIYPFEEKLVGTVAAELAIPVFQNFVPYVGAGFSVESIPFSSMSSFGLEDIQCCSAPFYAGIVVLQFLDFKFTCKLNNLLLTSNPKYFEDSYSIGCRFPLRQKNYTKITNGYNAYVGKHGAVTAAECSFESDKIFQIVFENGVTEISDFSNLSELTNVQLPDTLTVIGENSFANDSKLQSLEISNGVVEIRKGSFEGCTAIRSITIPVSVTKIEPGAFAGWTYNQTILLSWNSDDETIRDLSGLSNCDASILYADSHNYIDESKETK